MAKVYSPNKEYTGISASIAFAAGVGETDEPHLLHWFHEHGYRVEGWTSEKPDQTSTGSAQVETDLESDTVPPALLEETKDTHNEYEVTPQPRPSIGADAIATPQAYQEVQNAEGMNQDGLTGYSELQKMSLEELKVYAAGQGIYLGNATTENGIRKKIQGALHPPQE